MQEALEEKKQILEIGNVLNHYYSNSGRWVVLDKFEKAHDVINEDVVEYEPKDKLDLILSISTMEHVGFDDDTIDTSKVTEAIKHISTLLNPKGIFIFSVPLGYNTDLDNKIFLNTFGLSKIVYLKRVGFRKWKESFLEDITKVRFNDTYPNANALAMCFYKK